MIEYESIDKRKATTLCNQRIRRHWLSTVLCASAEDYDGDSGGPDECFVTGDRDNDECRIVRERPEKMSVTAVK